MREIGCVLGLSLIIVSACTLDESGEPGDGEAGQGGQGSEQTESGGSAPLGGNGGAEAGSGGVLGGEGGGGAGEPPVTGGACHAGTSSGGSSGAGANAGEGGKGGAGANSGEGGEGGVTPELPPWQPPGGCTVRSQTMSASGCSLGLDCAGQESISCNLRASGAWECRSAFTEAAPLEITGLVGLRVCQSAANLFLTGEDDIFTGEEQCELELQQSSPTACEKRQRCERSAAPSTGVSGRATRRQFVICTGTPLSCRCDTGNRYKVEGVEPAAACEQLFDRCDEPNPEPTGEEECIVTDAYPDYLDNVCRGEADCTAELEPGIFALYDPMIECDEDGYCQCFSSATAINPKWAYFNNGEPTQGEDGDTCRKWVPYCAPPIEFVPTEGATCTNGPVSVREDNGSCTMQRTCTGPALLQDQPVSLGRGSVSITCAQGDDGVRCRCSSRGETFLVDAPYAEACTAAVELCEAPVAVGG
ncbi:MAG: hypothetical protein M3020_10885 [Myxococcota bacterium]|nr:hypothetical protein [Myxococcota bacterium]